MCRPAWCRRNFFRLQQVTTSLIGKKSAKLQKASSPANTAAERQQLQAIMPLPTPIRVGLVGAGLSATTFHAPFLKQSNAFSITGVLRGSSTSPVPGLEQVCMLCATAQLLRNSSKSAAGRNSSSQAHCKPGSFKLPLPFAGACVQRLAAFPQCRCCPRACGDHHPHAHPLQVMRSAPG